MYYVYVLLSLKDGKLYIGFSGDLRARLIEHSDGLVVSTRNRRPLKLVYYEAYTDKKDAESREKYLKGGGKARNELKLRLRRSLKECSSMVEQRSPKP